MTRTLLVVALSLAAVSSPALAQAPAATAPAETPRPAADPKDVESIDAIIAAVYAAISGPAGQPRQWDRFRSLMAPGARLMPTGRRQSNGVLRVWSVEEYIAAATPQLVPNGFYERELGRKMERYGNIVHLMSAYDSKRSASDAQPFTRGVNSFQLWFDGTRWWVVSIFWEAETPENPIPAELLQETRP
jgi:hypothetical protein